MREFAPAKVNLTLHVTGRRSDGYHLLDSLVVFPRLGDEVAAEPAAATSLAVTGRFAAGLGGDDDLVLRAAALLGRGERHARLQLRKRLPVGGGLGGGSADAAATLRLLARLWGVGLPRSGEVLRLGADVPACLASRSCRMSGIGEVLQPMGVPAFWLVLVNPAAAISTAAAFAALGGRCGAPMADPPDLREPREFFAFVAAQRNDLEPAAVSLAPGIALALAALAAQPCCSLARISGSGATCFGLFEAEPPACLAARAIARAEPDWWVCAAPVGRSIDQVREGKGEWCG